MHHPKPATAPWRVRGIVLLVLAVAAVVAPQLSQAEATDTDSVVKKYLGKWNYDQPDHDTMTNIATSNVPGRSEVPQIGDVVFTAEGQGRIVGRTDVGCTWRFKATSESLELDPPSQLCHNPTSNVAYTLTKWTVTVQGDHEKESITAKSHHPTGDYEFALDKGARTRATEFDPDAATKFTGAWTYDPADEQAGVNIRTTVRTAPDGTRTVERTPELGQVRILRNYDNRITAWTDNGCTWSLLTRGNTAKLDPPVQTCTLPTSKAVTISYWTIATDGRKQASVMSGTDERGGEFALSEGSLSKT